MRTELHLRWLRLKRHLLTCADLEARRTNRRARRLLVRLDAGFVPTPVRLCRRPAALAA
jgi:hypothetical protein